MSENEKKADDAVKIIFPCSGAADMGEVADRAGRALARSGAGKMSCLAGIGGGVKAIHDVTAGAVAVLAIDGCPQECARKVLIEAGFANFQHLKLAELGMKKGSTPAHEANVQAAVNAAGPLLRN